MNPIQRTMVIALGETADLVGQQLAKRLSEPNEPAEAVSLLSLAQPDQAAIESGLLSHASRLLPQQLAAKGWHLDRLDELALFVVADLPLAHAAELATLVETVAADHLGLSTIGLLLPLDAAQAGSFDSTLQNHFLRGILPLSLTNAVGLRLADEAELAAIAAEMLYALIATPLRDAPEWLLPHGGQAVPILSAGIASWCWHPEKTAALLAAHWQAEIVTSWRQASVVPESEQMAHAFLGMHKVGEVPPPTPINLPPLSPVTLHQRAAMLFKPIEQLSSSTPVDERPFLALIQAQVERLIDEKPSGGCSTAWQFLTTIESVIALQIEEGEAELAAAELALEEQKAAWEMSATQHRTFLNRWPKDSWLRWLKILCLPWRWLSLAQEWIAVQESEAVLQQQFAQYEQASWQAKQLCQFQNKLTGRQAAVGQVKGRVEELLEMLATLIVPVSLPPLAKRLNQKLTHGTAWEAEEAATQIGGLATHLTQLDDIRLRERLGALGQARFADVSRLGVADAVQQLNPTLESLKSWWETLCGLATPLWRMDAGQCGAQRQAGGVAITAVFGGQQLAEPLQLHDDPSMHWHPGRQDELIVLRLQARSDL